MEQAKYFLRSVLVMRVTFNVPKLKPVCSLLQTLEICVTCVSSFSDVVKSTRNSHRGADSQWIRLDNLFALKGAVLSFEF